MARQFQVSYSIIFKRARVALAQFATMNIHSQATDPSLRVMLKC